MLAMLYMYGGYDECVAALLIQGIQAKPTTKI